MRRSMRNVLFVLCSFLCVMVLGPSACSPPQICAEGEDLPANPTSLNAGGSPCKSDCECSNQVFEGYCKKETPDAEEGICVVIQRETCNGVGRIATCIPQLPPLPADAACRTGYRICKPDYLETSMWGNCEPLEAFRKRNNITATESDEKTCGDGVDNDCNGKTDKSDPACKDFCDPGQRRVCFTDKDNKIVDGRFGDAQQQAAAANTGSCSTGFQFCKDGKWDEECVGEKKPAAEVCDGVDNDCDGKIDNGVDDCKCTPGTKEPCYDGPSGTQNVGPCKNGIRTCGGDGLWGACEGAVYPTTQACKGVDDDCDGLVDEGCPCLGEAPRDCGSSLGSCQAGKQRCESNIWSSLCYAYRGPTPEVCDNDDNDCDGQVDEGLRRSCSYGCKTDDGKAIVGVERCEGGSWTGCSAPKPPQEECNGKDDDCDGTIDNMTPKACKHPTCGDGLQFCAKGVWSSCFVPPSGKEVCNNKDDNCDGNIDEGLVRTCKNSCNVEGAEFCLGGQWVGCTAPTPLPFEYCDGKDNDCNGQIDDNVTDIGRSCAIPQGKGVCGTGTITACNGGKPLCTANTATAESCNGLDDDCDGQVDEGTSSCVSVFAGKCGVEGYKDGTLDVAMFSSPAGMAVNPSNSSLYLADPGNKRYRLITRSGVVSTIAGDGTSGYLEGPALMAKFMFPMTILAPDESMTKMYLLDTSNSMIRAYVFKTSTKGAYIESIAGTGKTGSADGLVGGATFTYPGDITKGNISGGILYVADTSNNKIRTVVVGSNVTTLAGQAGGGFLDGTLSTARFNIPSGVSFDFATDTLYVADTANHRVRAIDISKSLVSTLAGDGKCDPATGMDCYKDGSTAIAQFIRPRKVLVHGNVLYVLEEHRIRAINLTTKMVSTIAGDGKKGYKNGPALQAQFGRLSHMVVGQNGDLIVSDAGNHCLLRISLTP